MILHKTGSAGACKPPLLKPAGPSVRWTRAFCRGESGAFFPGAHIAFQQEVCAMRSQELTVHCRCDPEGAPLRALILSSFGAFLRRTLQPDGTGPAPAAEAPAQPAEE